MEREFKDITNGEITHTTILDTAGVADYRSVIGNFAQSIMKDLRLVGGYDALYGKVKAFVRAALSESHEKGADDHGLGFHHQSIFLTLSHRQPPVFDAK